MAIRAHYYLNSIFIFKGLYRFYQDDFGLVANTFELEIPIKVSQGFSFYPYFRHHIQSAVDYFAPFGEHDLTATYYTSDFDLSDFNSQQIGLGLKYEPLFGIGKTVKSKKNSILKFKSINVRAADYRRSDGLNTFIVSFGLSFKVF